MDVDLRKLRYFVSVAEQLHFGRAAESLHIAQPVLSRQIRALEDELKVRLFERDRRTTSLTPAGHQLLADAKPLLAHAGALRRRVGRAARGSFTVGFMPGLIVTAAVRAFGDRHPDLAVDVVRTTWSDQTDVLHDGRVDVGYVRLPVDRRGLTIRPLLSEPRVAVLPADHRLAGKDVIEMADLSDERLLQDPALVPEWPGLFERTEPLPTLVEEKLERVAVRRGVVVFPRSTAAFYTRPDIAYVLISDIGPSQVGLAWDSGRRSPLIAEFAAIAEATSPVA
jgi:DNA-binding transcriptional LysR family regulator